MFAAYPHRGPTDHGKRGIVNFISEVGPKDVHLLTNRAHVARAGCGGLRG